MIASQGAAGQTTASCSPQRAGASREPWSSHQSAMGEEEEASSAPSSPGRPEAPPDHVVLRGEVALSETYAKASRAVYTALSHG